MSANDKVIKHYNAFGSKQHWDLVYEYLDGDYLLGNATKYIFRFGKKGSPDDHIEDLKKAIHYLEKKIEILQEDDGSHPTAHYVRQD
jgi:hypothetical protein